MENQIHNYFFLSRNRFVNSYNLYVWKNGQQKDQGQKISNITNCTTSTVLFIEPCVSYNFAVEFIEHDWAKADIKSTKFFRYYISRSYTFIIEHKYLKFQVSYGYNPNHQSRVLNKASIKFSDYVMLLQNK